MLELGSSGILLRAFSDSSACTAFITHTFNLFLSFPEPCILLCKHVLYK